MGFPWVSLKKALLNPCFVGGGVRSGRGSHETFSSLEPHDVVFVQRIALLKFNSSPLKIGRAPKGSRIIFLCHPFLKGELLNFGGVGDDFVLTFWLMPGMS